MKRNHLNHSENSNSTEREDKYILQNKNAEQLVKKGSESFRRFKQRANNSENPTQALEESANFYKEAITVCKKQKARITDEAFCRRKYATVITRITTIDHAIRYQDAEEHLRQAIKQYEFFLYTARDIEQSYRSVLTIELQRTLVYLGHVALELKKGSLLELARDTLMPLLKTLPNPAFEFEAYTYSYHINLAKNNITAAQDNLRTLEELSDHMQTSNPTDFRHLAKINLLMVQTLSEQERAAFFTEQVQKIFWKAFDAHKSELFQIRKQRNRIFFNKHCKSINSKLLKDFTLFLYMKIVQRLNHIPEANLENTKKSVYEYIEKQVEKVYKNQPQQINMVLKYLKEQLRKIKESGIIALGYHLYESSLPAHIAISEPDFNELFPEYSTLIANEANNEQLSQDNSPNSIQSVNENSQNQALEVVNILQPANTSLEEKNVTAEAEKESKKEEKAVEKQKSTLYCMSIFAATAATVSVAGIAISYSYK